MTLADFADVDFGVRLTSVGTIGGSRADSSKIMETTSTAIDAKDDAACVDENATASGNVLANDATNGGTTTVTGWSGGALGQAVTLANSAGVTLTLNAYGSWSLDASSADALSEGEHLTYSFTYDAKNQTELTSWSNDSATITVCVDGKNDGPTATDDASNGCVDENSAATGGNVLANDSDIDRLDTISLVSWQGGDLGSSLGITNAAGAAVTLNANGSWTVDAGSADALSAGEHITESFSYTITDNNGATASAAFTVEVCGVNDGPVAQDDGGGCMNEDGSLSGSVVANDSDVDRLDTHTWSLVADSFDGRGNLTFNEDGSWSYDAGGAYDGLNDGDHVELSFQYQMADNHGGTDTASVSFCIDGVGSITPPPVDDPALEFLFNHGQNKTDHGSFPQTEDKDNVAEGFTDNDTLKIAGYGDLDSITVFEGYFVGEPTIKDTVFVLEIGGNPNSTRTEDVGFLADYTGLEADQIVVTGNFDENNIFIL